MSTATATRSAFVRIQSGDYIVNTIQIVYLEMEMDWETVSGAVLGHVLTLHMSNGEELIVEDEAEIAAVMAAIGL